MYYILTKPDCIYCERAKELLDEKGEGYQAFSITESPLYVRLLFKAGLRTVPQIWHDAEYIGGYDALKTYMELD